MEVVYKGRYQRLERIGSGASGVIYKVKSQPEGRILIAKHIPLFKLEKSTALQEFKILQKLKHHYIVRYEDSFEHDDELVLIMQYCGEKDLAWHIEQRRQNGRHFSEYLVTNWILQLLLAVGFMHSNKIVHRDLKPQNVFVDSDMNLKVGDFGISRILDTTGQHCQTSAGTPSYMAPEIVDSQDYNFKADIWSLGCIIWEICTLQRLFPLRDENDKPIGLIKMMDLIKHKEIKQIPGLYSEDLRKLVKKMLIRSPEKRPKAEDLLKDKLLVQLMINRINEKDNLKQEYPKGQDVPSLSNSLLDRQANAVKLQLRKLEEEVEAKMQGLKQKKVEKNQLESFEKQLKKKMSEVENAVKLAFKELYSNGKFEQQGKGKEQLQNSSKGSIKSSSVNSSKGNISNDSLENSSDVTIQSVELQSNRQLNNESELTLLQSAMIETKKLQSLGKEKETVDNTSKATDNKGNNSSIKKNASVRESSLKNSSAKEERRIQDFEGTLQSQFTNTIQTDYLKSGKEPQILTTTINKLDLLKNTLKNNPEAVLSNSFLTCTLSMSTDPLLQSHKKEKHDVSATESFDFDFTKASSPNRQKLHELEKKEKSPQEAGYDDDFEDYNENEELNMRRQAELNSMLALYEQELARQESFNAMSEGFKYRNKYLVMSEIKEQSYEGGSMISKNESLD